MLMMEDFPLVSVITTSYRKFEYAEKTVCSVLEQNYPNIQFILADDGSDNFDYSFFETLLSSRNVCNYLILHNCVNVGTVMNINNACKHALGKYIIFLSMGDVFYSNNSLKDIVMRAIESNAEVLSFSRMLWDKKDIRMMPLPYFYSDISKLSTPTKQYYALLKGQYYEMASGSAVCILRQTIEELGLYDERYKYWEDGPFFARANKRGILIKTAYDIVGIRYLAGGISDKKKKDKFSNLLQKDAVLFYKTELKYIKKTSVKRFLKYSVKFNAVNRFGLFFLRLRYLDVLFSKAFYKYRLRKAINQYVRFNNVNIKI